MDIYSAPKNTIRTNSGLFINVFDTDPETIVIEDIAHASAMIPRFGGHLDEFYSVAQHAVLCFYLALEYGMEYALDALLHDASEAFILDMPTPIKNNLPDYKAVEHKLMCVIAEKFGFTYPLNSVLKEIDARVLQIEWKNMVDEETKFTDPNFVCLSPKEAKAEFLNCFRLIQTFMKQLEIAKKAEVALETIDELENATS